MFRSIVVLIWLALGMQASAAELKGVGLFETLKKPWFATALYVEGKYAEGNDGDRRAAPLRLEFKVVEERISQRRFRQLWSEVLAVATPGTAYEQRDFDRFLSSIKGALKQNDHLILSQKSDYVSLVINYHEHARLPHNFLIEMVNMLTARIAPIPELKHGLLGSLPKAQLRQIQSRFDQGEPSLRRISQTARWLRQQKTAATSRATAEPQA